MPEDFELSNIISPRQPRTKICRVAILFSGGPAPTANSVIGSAAVCIPKNKAFYGFLCR
ncbi:MAG: hypothetical protein LBT46_08125 [Planctomycetaceae bacterium]|nr:hypothetical protein [Planctomycetaceae bacterium]